jgi:hypothetical protein
MSLHAIADPTPGTIIGKLAGKPLNLNAVTENFDISREQFCEVHLQELGEN